MPELPEVETVRRSLVPALTGRTIESITIGNFPGVIGSMSIDELRGLVVGRSVTDLRRRGKYLMIDFDDGSGLIVHLRMTGALTVLDQADGPVRFEYISFELNDRRSLRFSDQRKFGRIEYRPADNLHPLETKLGPEPLEAKFTAEYLARTIKGRSAPIKALILDQRLIAGVGNIYADEALFRSRIHPLTPGGELTPAQISSLVRSIRLVLRAGIENRGTSFSSYRDGNGEAGSNQTRLRIYGRGRSGLPCLRCGGPLMTLTAGGRTSHVCPRCQPPMNRLTSGKDAAAESTP